MRITARNQLKGTIKKIEMGMIMGEVEITLEGGGEITSIITKKAVEDLGLKVGKEVYAVIKSTEIMVGVD